MEQPDQYVEDYDQKEIIRQEIINYFVIIGTSKTRDQILEESIPSDLTAADFNIKKENRGLPTYPDFEKKLDELGWLSIGLAEYSNFKFHYVYENNIAFPKQDVIYAYHGSASIFYRFIKEKGLDSGENIEINPGAMKSEKSGVCYATYISLPKDFAQLTTAKIKENKKTQEALAKKGFPFSAHDYLYVKPIIYRWKLSGDISKGDTIGVTSSVIKPHQLEFTLGNFSIWYPMEKFNIQHDINGCHIEPDYANVEVKNFIATLDEFSSSGYSSESSSDDDKKNPVYSDSETISKLGLWRTSIKPNAPAEDIQIKPRSKTF